MRLTGFGASEVPALLRLYPWKDATGPEDVIAEKLGDKPAFEGNARTRLGDRLEPFIAQWWAEDHGGGRIVTRNPDTLRHPEIPWLLATPDYLTPEGEPVQCKLVSTFSKKHWATEPAPWAWVQLQVELAVLGRPRGYLAAHIEGDDVLVRSYPVEFDPENFSDIVKALAPHWARVEAARAERAQRRAS